MHTPSGLRGPATPLFVALCLTLAGCGTQQTGTVGDVEPTPTVTATDDAVEPQEAAPAPRPTAGTTEVQPNPTNEPTALPPGYGPDGNEEEEYGEGYDAEGFGPDGNEEELYGEGIDADDTDAQRAEPVTE